MTSTADSSRNRNNNKSSQVQAAALLFTNIGLIGTLIILVIAAWFRLVPIVIMTGLILSTITIARAWSSLSLRRVKYERLLDEYRFFPGEETPIKVRVTNRKPLPLVWLQVEDKIPEGLAINSEATSDQNLTLHLSMRWYQRITWDFNLKAIKRGYYLLGPAQLSSGDVFGLYPRTIIEPVRQEIIVYPKIYPLTESSLPAAQLWGNIKTHNIFADITRFKGLREYRPEDSYKFIHWKASARSGELQVKTFESTASMEALLLVDIDSLSIASEETFEVALSTAASVANHLFNRGYPVGLMVNTVSADRREPIVLLPGSSPDQMNCILEALAKTTSTPRGTIEELMKRQYKKPGAGTTIVLVAASPSANLVSYLEFYRRHGYRITTILIGEGEKGKSGSNEIYQAYPPGISYKTNVTPVEVR